MANAFAVVYHGKGFTWADVMGMSLGTFDMIVEKLSTQLKAEAEAQKQSMKRSKAARR